MENKAAFLTVKNVLRVLASLLLILVFCPTFLVSCSGQQVKVGVMQGIGGVKVNGEKVANGNFLMILCLLIPIAILVVLFTKKFLEKKAAMIVAGASALDFLIWVIFKNAVEKKAAESYCAFDITFAYILNMCSLIALVVISVLVVIGKLELENGFKMAAGGTKAMLPQGEAQAPQMKFCSECGAKLTGVATFCGSCGAKVE